MRVSDYIFKTLTEHINHFSSRAMKNLLRNHGFSSLREGKGKISIGQGIDYPTTWVYFCGNLQKEKQFKIDNHLKHHIKQYIKYSENDCHYAIISKLAESGEPLIVWGVGCSTTRLLSNTALHKANIVAFVDNNPKYWWDKLLAKPIIKPSELIGRNETVVVTSKLYGEQIIEQLRNGIGCQKIVAVF